jgi:hypothetical protein
MKPVINQGLILSSLRRFKGNLGKVIIEYCLVYVYFFALLFLSKQENECTKLLIFNISQYWLDYVIILVLIKKKINILIINMKSFMPFFYFKYCTP